MSPLEIEVLLHIYAIAEPWPRPSEAYAAAIKKFIVLGVVRADSRSDSGYRTTSRGDAWVTSICATPCPRLKSVFVDPRTDEVIGE